MILEKYPLSARIIFYIVSSIYIITKWILNDQNLIEEFLTAVSSAVLIFGLLPIFLIHISSRIRKYIHKRQFPNEVKQ